MCAGSSVMCICFYKVCRESNEDASVDNCPHGTLQIAGLNLEGLSLCRSKKQYYIKSDYNRLDCNKLDYNKLYCENPD